MNNQSEMREFLLKKSPKLFTLIIVVNNDEVLLGLKKRGFGSGKWNGFGGKVEIGETITDSAIRELHEECGLIASSLNKCGTIWFDNLEEPTTLSEVHIFIVEKFEGEIIESDEMIPKWFHKHSIPFNCMWPSNKYWLPLVLNNKKFDAYFLFKNEEEMLNFKILEH